MSGPVRVLIDATNCKPGQGGVRTYTLELCSELAAVSGIALSIATSTHDFDHLSVEVLRVPAATRSPAVRASWRERSLTSAVRVASADVVFSPVPELPIRLLPVPTVMVVHDVGPVALPALYGRARWLRYRVTLPRTLRLATKVVCVSEATRCELVRNFDVDPVKCVVVGEGPQSLTPGDSEANPRIVEPYVLYIGSLYRHKNVPTLIRAWQHGGVLDRTRLIVVGPHDTRGMKRVIAAADDAGVRERVTLAGFVEPARLAALLRGARAVALPSLYEGFGLTALEAMAAGVPVVASAIPALAELVGDAGLLVTQPTSSASWHSALCQVLSDSSTRLALSGRGQERARGFTWARAAAELAQTLVELAA